MAWDDRIWDGGKREGKNQSDFLLLYEKFNSSQDITVAYSSCTLLSHMFRLKDSLYSEGVYFEERIFLVDSVCHMTFRSTGTFDYTEKSHSLSCTEIISYCHKWQIFKDKKQPFWIFIFVTHACFLINNYDARMCALHALTKQSYPRFGFLSTYEDWISKSDTTRLKKKTKKQPPKWKA